MLYIVGDIGGTNTRLALCSKDTDEVNNVRYFKNSDFSSFSSILANFTEGIEEGMITKVCLGVAANISGGVAHLTNISWSISTLEISNKLRLEQSQIFLLNDLEALAYRVSGELGRDVIVALNTPEPEATGNKLVVAVGTGLGISICHGFEGRYVPMATEAGHLSFSVGTKEDESILAFAREYYSHVSVERLVSGAFGFRLLYDYYAAKDEFTQHCVANLPDLSCGPEVVAEALSGNPLCATVCEKMIDILAGHIGNIALVALPAGGIYLTGSVVKALNPFIDNRAFIKKMTDKGRYKEYLKSLAVMLYTEEDAALLGCKKRLEMSS